MKIAPVLLSAVLAIAGDGCSHSIGSSPKNVQKLIQTQIDQGLEGTRNKDIDRSAT